MKSNAILVLMLLGTLGAFAQPKIKFLETKHDYGSIKEDGGKVSFVFGFENVGDEPLIIKNVKTPCGCTSPQWVKAAIPPGSGGYVEATFDPMHRPGVFNKVMTVIANTEPTNSYLTIFGEVLPRKRTIEDNFPIVKGNLRFTSPQIYLGKVRVGEIDTLHVRMYNEGSQIINIKQIASGSHISSEIVKGQILPKAFGKFVVSYDAAGRGDFGTLTDQVVVITDDPRTPEKSLYTVAEVEPRIRPLTPAELAEAPRLEVEENVLDLGEVIEGKTIIGKFKVSNVGNGSLRILRVKPECGCTSTTIRGELVEKDKATYIDLKFDSKGYNGLIVKEIDVYSNDPVNPKTTLKVRAYVNKRS